jgi:hypothetical protein
MNFSTSLKHHAFDRHSWIRFSAFIHKKHLTLFLGHTLWTYTSNTGWNHQQERKKSQYGDEKQGRTCQTVLQKMVSFGPIAEDLCLFGRDILYQKCRSFCCLYSKLPVHINHCLDFSFVFLSSLPAWKKPGFSKGGSSTVEGTSQAALGSSDQRNVPASLSLFLKREKIPALFYVGKGLSIGPSVIWDLCLRPVLRPFSYAKKNSKVNHELATTRE